MKIGIIVRRLNVKGGTQRQALCLARELMRRGHDVMLYTFLLSSGDCYSELLKGLRVVALGFYPKGGMFGDIAENRAARMLAASIDPTTDILNPHDQVAYKVAAYFKKRVRKIPSVWMMNDVPTRRRAEERLKEAKPGIVIPWYKRVMHSLLDWFDCRVFIRKQDIILALDRRDRGWAEEEFGIYTHVIRSGISHEQFPYRERTSLAGRPVRLLMAGIFFPHRRFEDGIEAAALLRKQGVLVELTIAGDPAGDRQYARNIESLIRERGLDDTVKLAGKVSDQELVSMYRENDVFLFPSHLQSWGLAVFEAAASGEPVIVSRSAGASEVLTDGATALLVHPKSPEEIAEAVARLIDDPVLYEKLSREGRAFVEREISWARLADQMEKIFHAALQSRSAQSTKTISL